MVKDKKEHCGVFGIFDHPDAAHLAYLGLYALQHRGEESAGIVATDGKNIYQHKGMGLVGDVFTKEALHKLKRGRNAIGHTRYSTTGSSIIKNAQPFLVNFKNDIIAIAHNGNLVNATELKASLEKEGSIFQTTMDSEIIVHLIVKSQKSDFIDSVKDGLRKLRGAFALAIMTKNKLIGVRDPNGFRPLCLGIVQNSFVLASETCALDLIQAKFIREIEPGELVVIDKYGIKSYKPFEGCACSQCIFEFIYFARPDSYIFGDSVYNTRKRLGRILAKEHPAVGADLVTSIPDSGSYAAIGFSEVSKIPLELGMIRNHYIGRTFIQPSQYVRNFKVRVKLNPINEVIKGKKIVVVEDSIVRGTTCKMRINALREAGAKEIHMRISCPPLRFPCFYGIDFPTRKQLIAAQKSIEDIKKFLELDSLGYLSLEGMLLAMKADKKNFCCACYTGKYPVAIDKNFSKLILEKRNKK